MTEVTIEERLRLLEAKLTQEEAARQVIEKDRHAAPEPRGRVAEQLRAQEDMRQVRIAASREAAAAHERQLASVQPRIEKLEAELRALDATDHAERERHQHAIEQIAAQRRMVNEKLSQLQRPKVTVEDLLASPERQAAMLEISERLMRELSPVGMSFKRPTLPASTQVNW